MRSLVLALILLLAPAGPSWADRVGFPGGQPTSPCRAAIRQVEGASGGIIPDHLLAAIARIESGRRDPQTGRFTPWPWTINAEGKGFFFESKAEAIAAVRDLQSSGVRSIDVGCMQINLMHHPNAFGSLEQAFDPNANAAYGARFLMQLHDQSGDWTRATGLYHSATPDLAADYQRQVLAALPAEKQEAGDARLTQMATASTQLATPWRSTMAPMQPATPGAVALPFSQGDKARIIPLGSGSGGVTQGRGLDAYRAAPIALASRLFRSPGG